ncbi:MAG: hypothetical protein NVSMB6_27810 [Burkholderiaceae bacterium]
MQRPDKTVPKKARESEEDKDEATTFTLCELAVTLAHGVSRSDMAASRTHTTEFHKIIKRSLHQKKDEVLYDALARTENTDRDAALYLKQVVEELAEMAVVERAEGKKMEINAFTIPLFLHSTGGLDAERCFQDQDAFEALSKSFQLGQLESPDATVVLVNHGYHVNEIDAITYSHLHEMLRDAFAAMTDKRTAATPAINRSIGGWPDSPFGPDDRAVELRFLVGFSLKSIEDPFYAIPEEEAAADAYFSSRELLFQEWAVTVAPLVMRCFGLDPLPDTSGANGASGERDDVHFLYQDLFHGGKERGIAEYFMLQLISDLNQNLARHAVTGDQAQAVLGPANLGEEIVLRVQLHATDGGALLAQANKPVYGVADWPLEFADVHGALAMIGVSAVSIATCFDSNGAPLDAVPYKPAVLAGSA